MIRELSDYAVLFWYFVVGTVVMVVFGTLLLLLFPVALAANLISCDSPRIAWRDTLELFLPRRRKSGGGR